MKPTITTVVNEIPAPNPTGYRSKSFSVGTMSGYHINGIKLNVSVHYTRPVKASEKRTPEHTITRLIRKCDLDGRIFPDRESAYQAALERGYLKPYQSKSLDI